MKIYLCTESLSNRRHWQESLKEFSPLSPESFPEEGGVGNSSPPLVICDLSPSLEESAAFVKKYASLFHFLILERIPQFDRGKAFLKSGARGYGNALMDSVHLQSAVKTVQAGQIWLYPDFISRLLGDLPLTGTKAASPSPLEKLTAREKEVALLLKKGLKNREIAEELKITLRTVKAHTVNIYGKLEVRDRMALALLLQ